jgi:hypothetical protein
MDSLRNRCAALLCLALVTLVGLTPAQGFVVCIEADGCVSIEIKAAEPSCASCEGHEPWDLTEDSDPTTVSECPCVDYVVPGFPEGNAFKKGSVEFLAGPWTAPTVEILVGQRTLPSRSERGPPPRTPRVARTLAHIRSVILLV